MQILYMLPAAVLWIVWIALKLLIGAHWFEYVVFGGACAATAVGWFLVILSSAGPRW